jgi:hypothetical protein
MSGFVVEINIHLFIYFVIYYSYSKILEVTPPNENLLNTENLLSIPCAKVYCSFSTCKLIICERTKRQIK